MLKAMTQKKSGGRKFAVVRPAVIATTFGGRSEKYAPLQRLNLMLAAAYGLQAVAVVLFGHGAWRPVTLQYLAQDPLQSAAQHHSVLTLASHRWWDMNIGVLLVLILVLAAVLHGLLATTLRVRYERALAGRLHDLRWFGYGLIGGLSVLVAAMLAGVADAAVLLMLLGATVAASLGAMAVEANRRFWPWALFAAVPAAAAVVAFACYLIGGAVYGAALPWHAYAAAAVIAAAGLGAAVNLYLQVRERGRWADYRFADVVYTALNFVLTTILTWVVFAGVLR